VTNLLQLARLVRDALAQAEAEAQAGAQAASAEPGAAPSGEASRGSGAAAQGQALPNVLLHALHARQSLYWVTSTALGSSWCSQLFSPLPAGMLRFDLDYNEVGRPGDGGGGTGSVGAPHEGVPVP
jgi:hypothetical protein